MALYREAFGELLLPHSHGTVLFHEVRVCANVLVRYYNGAYQGNGAGVIFLTGFARRP
jgi:hypothetical protein